MATGYTHCIKDGISFKDFTKRCAQAFLIEYRDCSSSTPIKRNIPVDDSYYQQMLQDATEKLDKLQEMSEEEANVFADTSFIDRTSDFKKYLNDAISLKEKYEDMLAKIEAWNTPIELNNLKDFMISQIMASIGHDCDMDYYENAIKEQTKKVKITGKEWLKLEIASAKRDIKYAKENIDKEVASNKNRNDWVDALLDNLENI